MAQSQSEPRRYWIFKDSITARYFPEERGAQRRVPVGPVGIRNRDFVYYWGEDDDAFVYAWGEVSAEPLPIHTVPGESLFEVKLRTEVLLHEHVMRRELQADPSLGSLADLGERSENVIQINSAQAVALNRLIREHGSESPSDPPFPVRNDGVAGGVPLGLLVAKYSLRLSGLTGVVLTRAGEFGSIREEESGLLTTSCILFAAAESGIHQENSEVGNASQFLFQALNAHGDFQQRLKKFLGPTFKKSLAYSSVLTLNALQVVETANRIAAFVRKETLPPAPGTIYARDLVGALLFSATKNPKLGAARRLAAMDINVKTLCGDYLQTFLKHPKNPEDDIEKWQRVLIALDLPEPEPVPRRVPRLTSISLPAVDADTPSLIDDLNITPEVVGFANIIAARDVKTPLSIGLFGDWGSGKSTFMEQLQACVEAIAKGVREKKADEETSFLGNIVQIKFNAWHYAEANLWASLVSHVFENLSFSEAEEKEKAEKRKQLLLSRLVSTIEAQRVAEADVRAKEVNYEMAKTALDSAERERNNARVELTQVVAEGIWPIVTNFLALDPEAQGQITQARDALGQAGLTEEELKREIDATRTTAGRIQLRITLMANDRRRAVWAVSILAAFILIPLGLAFLVSRFAASGILERLITSVTPWLTLIGGVIAWLQAKRGKLNSMVSTLDAAYKQIDKMSVRARAKYDVRCADLAKEVAEKGDDIGKAKQELKDAQQDQVETIAALREMEPGRVLETFVQERAASEDYRKLLGVVALIRRDFKRLSEMMYEQNNKELRQAVTDILKKAEEQPREEKAATGDGNAGIVSPVDNPEETQEQFDTRLEEALEDYRIDRIVLYIDDLDRCPPKQVVDVLQAIHLLLAFKLFVVVVGVDARWIRHALRQRYPELLSRDWEEAERTSKGDAAKAGEEQLATPRDYIEKIFQVPFWLKPLDDDGARSLLKSLIPDSQISPVVKSDGNGAGVPGQETAVLAGAVDSTKDASLRTDLHEKPGNDTRTILPSDAEGALKLGGVGTGAPSDRTGGNGEVNKVPKKPPLELKPESLLLDEKEREAMIALSRIIGRTPRTLKRFVNVYRIIKAALSAEQLEAFTGTGPSDAQYKAVLLLLGVAYGAPDLAPVFFLELKHEYEATLDGKQKAIGLKTFLKRMSPPPTTVDNSLKKAWVCFIKDLEKVVKEDIPLADLRKWLPVVVRYTFQLGRLSEEVANPVDSEVSGGTSHA